MESYWIILINSVITLLVGGWIFKYFDSVFKSQVEITDKIINHLTNSNGDTDYLYEVGYDLDNTYTVTTLDDYFEEE